MLILQIAKKMLKMRLVSLPKFGAIQFIYSIPSLVLPADADSERCSHEAISRAIRLRINHGAKVSSFSGVETPVHAAQPAKHCGRVAASRENACAEGAA